MTEEARQRAGWTRELPKVPGFYWWRNLSAKYEEDREVVIYKVRDYVGKLAVGNCTIKDSHYQKGEWRGPITPDDGDREYQRGLEAAANVVRAQAGGLTREACAGCGNEDDVAEGAANDALRYAADTLDRLAQEARRGGGRQYVCERRDPGNVVRGWD